MWIAVVVVLVLTTGETTKKVVPENVDMAACENIVRITERLVMDHAPPDWTVVGAVCLGPNGEIDHLR